MLHTCKELIRSDYNMLCTAGESAAAVLPLGEKSDKNSGFKTVEKPLRLCVCACETKRSMLARHQIKFAIARGDAPPPVCDKQFATTSKTGTEYVASRRSEVPDRAQMAAELRCRKINNTKTSISFGNAPIKWETDAQVLFISTAADQQSLVGLFATIVCAYVG